MKTNMEMAEREDKLLTDMLDIIRFTEVVSVKLHRVTDEARIYQVVKDEFAKSDRYLANILLLVDDGASLRLAETSMLPSKLEVLEKASGLKAKEYRIQLSKSGIFRQVVREGKTVRANVSEMISEFLPQPLAYLISKTMGYEKQTCILTPLYKHGNVIGVLVMSCTDLCEYFTHSAENLALHISTALELAHKNAQRNRALQALKRYHDHLGELVEERTAELKKVNEKLLEDITERKRAEEALADEVTRRRILVDQSLDGIVVLDEDARVYEANQRFAEMLGYTPEEVRELHTWDWDKNFPPEKLLEMGRAVDEKGLHLETQHHRKDGSVIDVDISINGAMCAGQKLIFCVCRDITERKRAEEALQTEKNKLQSLTDAMENGLSIQDTGYNIIYQNEPSKKGAGGDRVGEKCYRAYEGKEEVCDGCPVEKAFKDDGSHTAERKVIAPSGEVAFWENTANPIRDARGRIVSCLEVTRNITERKKAEEALKESREKFQKMFESVTDGISVVDLNGVIIEANQRTVEMHGFTSKDELLGRNALELVAPRDRERVTANMRKAIREGAIIGAEYTLLKADGSEFPGELSSSILKDASGNRVGHATISRDITERKLMEEALRESEERFRSIVENSQAGIMILDDAYRLIYVNDELCRISGYSREEAIGRDFRQFLDEESRQLVADRYIRRQRGEEVTPRYEFNIVCKDGEKKRVEISSAVIRDLAGKVKTVAQILDITERKQAEQALQAEKNKLQSVIDAMADGLSIRDKDSNIIYQSEPSKRIFGDHPGEKCYRAYEGREEVCEGCPAEKAFEDGKPHTSERRVVLPSGEVTFWELCVNPIRDAGGRIVSCLEVGRNITERKQAEERLQLLSSVTQQISDATLVTDLDFHITYVNKAAQDLFGYSAEEMLGKHMDFFNVEIPSEGFKQELVQAVCSGGLWVGTLVKRRKDGSTFLSECHISQLYDKEGQVLSYIDVLRDVTERKQAEEALRESQKFSSSLLESSPNPISVVDLDTSTRYVNPAFEKLTGFTLAELAGRKAPYPWWPEGEKGEIHAAFKDAIEHGGKRTGSEHSFQKKNGERFWVTLNSAPVIQDGKPVYLIISWLDITERKRAEEKAKQLQQELYLAQRLASVGELAAGVAHEINNPLTGVLGFSQRLMRKSTDEQVRRDLEIIHSEARRAADVVQNLLTFARRRQPKKEYAGINDIIQRTLELRAYALQTSNIEVTTAFTRSLPEVMVDFPQMQEVFLNIILNAEQAMSEAHGRGKLVIKTRRVKDHLRVSFADDGPGISPENLDKIFDPFFTTREEKGGTGLGLSACHGIVTEHGGRIYARSKPGKGATFIVELPLSPLETNVTRRV